MAPASTNEMNGASVQAQVGSSALARSDPVVLGRSGPCQEQDQKQGRGVKERQHHPRRRHVRVVGMLLLESRAQLMCLAEAFDLVAEIDKVVLADL